MRDEYETVRLSTGAVIYISDIESILPIGYYPDEVTLVMKSGAKHFAGSGFNKTRSDTMRYWNNKVFGDS